MTEDPSPPATSSLADTIRHALEAAATATDAAEEASGIRAEALAAFRRAETGQKRLQALAIGTLCAGVVIGGLGALVALRSIADLREAGEIQAAAGKALVEQVQRLGSELEAAQAMLASTGTLSETFGARVDGLGDRLSGDLTRVMEEAATLHPQVAKSITDHLDTRIDSFRGEVLTALADGGALPATADPEMKALLAELRAQLDRAPAAASTPAAPPRAPAAARPSAPKARPAATAPEQGPFRFP